MRLPLLVAATLISGLAPANAQKTCGGANHYRWAEKIEASGTPSRVDTVTIDEILDKWHRPDIGKKDSDFCIARDPDERKRYAVTAWLWRVKLSEDDADYHLELTESDSAFSTRCLVAEIPDPQWGTGYGKVRKAFEKMIGGAVTDTKDFDKPLHVRVTGVAFWDGWHAGAQKPSSHGRCNAAGIGVWELHPITKIARAK
jgi:hypothetical protein